MGSYKTRVISDSQIAMEVVGSKKKKRKTGRSRRRFRSKSNGVFVYRHCARRRNFFAVVYLASAASSSSFTPLSAQQEYQVVVVVNDLLLLCRYVFLGIYSCEMVIKAVAKGLVLDRLTYLRSPWNWLDFVVILSGYATLAVEIGNLAGLRTFRVLRALKTVSIIPGPYRIHSSRRRLLRFLFFFPANITESIRSMDIRKKWAVFTEEKNGGGLCMEDACWGG